MLRFFIGLLLGVIMGAAGTAYFFSSGGGDHLISASPRVLRTEEDLRRVSQDQEQLAKKLEDTTARIEKMIDEKLTDFEHRIQTLENAGHKTAPEGTREEGQGDAVGSQS